MRRTKFTRAVKHTPQVSYTQPSLEKGLSKNQLISELSRSPHGKLEEYVPVGKYAAGSDPNFFAHLIAWNAKHGQIRDSQIALPVISLSVVGQPKELEENSLAHLAMLGPMELLKAVRFAWALSGRSKLSRIRPVVEQYLKSREEPWRKFDAIAATHRYTLKELYALMHIKPSARVERILFKNEYPNGSVYEAIQRLHKLTAGDAAAAVLEHRIPFPVVQRAMGKRIQDPDLALAIINQMTPTQLVTSTKLLERLGLNSNPALRGAYEKKLELVATRKTKATLKTGQAAKALEKHGDTKLAEKLHGVQQKQIQSMAVEGNWLVLADRSPSMDQAVIVAKQIAATLAGMVKGKVWLVFFDSTPYAIDVTETSLDIIEKATRHITAGGSGTSIGCGLQMMLELKREFDGIVIVSDGEENSTPYFQNAYKAYSRFVDKEVPVYLYLTNGSGEPLTRGLQQAGIDMQVFDLRNQTIDYYSLPNLVTTMRTNRYSLVDEIMSQRLLTLDEVFKSEGKEEEIHVA